MATHWKTYDGGPTPRHNNFLRASIDRKGTITLNKFTLNRLGDPEAVELLFDDQQSIIGITRGSLLNPKHFPVKVRAGDTHGKVRATPFLRYFGIRVDRTEGFDTPELDDEGILKLDLKCTHNLTRPKKRIDPSDR